ncbi:MAG: hypothetical protein DDT40_01162 [candidate division WS2 bacterium]|nr:hypothetical protein [Candidatus Psychracetigena formicireducens]
MGIVVLKLRSKTDLFFGSWPKNRPKIAAHHVNEQRIVEWRRLNSLKEGRPLVWIKEIPWHEMDVEGELELKTKNPFLREVEQQLRRTIYQWNHLQTDMVVEPKFYSPLVINDTGFGITEDVDIIPQDEKGGIISRHFHAQINNEKDLDKIKEPVITYDEEVSEGNYRALEDIFGDILAIEKTGVIHSWFAPWDQLVMWWGAQQALMDLAMRPELVHQAMDRLVNAYLSRLKQWRQLNLLSLAEGNYSVGSGGLGYTDELPKPDFNPDNVRTIDQWGAAAQIFSEVSPQMHEEFALRYEKRWLEQFGLNYYGCCEPLHNKIDIISSIPNLRKASISPTANVEKAARDMGNKYVFSYKPNPAILVTDKWNPDELRKDLKLILEKIRGCVVEVIMKDISTVRYQPQRLWEWSKMAMETALNMK